MFVKKNFLKNSSGMSLISVLIGFGMVSVAVLASMSLFEIIVKLNRKADILRIIDKKSEDIYKYLADYPICQANFQGQEILDSSLNKTEMISSNQIKAIDGSVFMDLSIPLAHNIMVNSIYLNNFRRSIVNPGNEIGIADFNIEFSYDMNGNTHIKQLSKLIFVEKFNDLINICGSNFDFNSHWMWNNSLSNSIYYPGKVGINTTTPLYSLDVVGDSVLNVVGGYAATDGGVRFQSSGNQVRIDNTEGGNFAFLTYSTTGKRLFATFGKKIRWSHYWEGPGQYQGYRDGGLHLMMSLANSSDEFWKFHVYRGHSGGKYGLRIQGENTNSIFRIRSDVNLFDTSGGGQKFYVSGTAGGPSSWNSLSDKRHKKNITKIKPPDVDKKFLALNEYQFEFKNNKSNKKHLGFVAQEVKKVLPEVVDTSGKYLKMDYGSINGLLIEKLKTMEKEHSNTKNQYQVLKAKICNKYRGLNSCQTHK